MRFTEGLSNLLGTGRFKALPYSGRSGALITTAKPILHRKPHLIFERFTRPVGWTTAIQLQITAFKPKFRFDSGSA
ncbi:hypothetical protein O4H61_04815 [Roseovarius aestuarii]|nr:hypothetical protein [Roseovarius aestuarii]